MVAFAGWFKRAFGGGGAVVDPPQQSRWFLDAAKTDRHNKAHWTNANDNPLNDQLEQSLPTLRARATYETANNGIIEGLVETLVCDLVGKEGPTLQVVDPDGEGSSPYGDELERVWNDFWAMPDIAGKLPGPEMLKLWVRTLWTCGEFVTIKVNDTTVPGPIRLRLQNVHPRRLDTPVGAVEPGDGGTLMAGVELSTLGRPLGYYILSSQSLGMLSFVGSDAERIPAEQVFHVFKTVEAEQVRGYPWLSSSLPSIASTRDFEIAVKDAAINAASMSVAITTDHPDADFFPMNETTKLKRGMMFNTPPGYSIEQINPTQPAANYVEYIEEQQRCWGRPVGIPLMITRLDSSGHNYSSARFDDQIYNRSLETIQGWLTRLVFDPLLRAIEQEWRLYTTATTGSQKRRPKRLRFVWTWQGRPHVDPVKENKGANTALTDHTIAFVDELARRGETLDELIAKQKRAIAKYEEAGLTPPAHLTGTAAGGTMDDAVKSAVDKAVNDKADDDDDDDGDGTTNGKKQARSNGRMEAHRGLTV